LFERGALVQSGQTSVPIELAELFDVARSTVYGTIKRAEQSTADG